MHTYKFWFIDALDHDAMVNIEAASMADAIVEYTSRFLYLEVVKVEKVVVGTDMEVDLSRAEESVQLARIALDSGKLSPLDALRVASHLAEATQSLVQHSAKHFTGVPGLQDRCWMLTNLIRAYIASHIGK